MALIDGTHRNSWTSKIPVLDTLWLIEKLNKVGPVGRETDAPICVINKVGTDRCTYLCDKQGRDIQMHQSV